MCVFSGCRAHSINLGTTPSLSLLEKVYRVRQEGTERDLKLLKTNQWKNSTVLGLEKLEPVPILSDGA